MPDYKKCYISAQYLTPGSSSFKVFTFRNELNYENFRVVNSKKTQSNSGKDCEYMTSFYENLLYYTEVRSIALIFKSNHQKVRLQDEWRNSENRFDR